MIFIFIVVRKILCAETMAVIFMRGASRKTQTAVYGMRKSIVQTVAKSTRMALSGHSLFIDRQCHKNLWPLNHNRLPCLLNNALRSNSAQTNRFKAHLRHLSPWHQLKILWFVLLWYTGFRLSMRALRPWALCTSKGLPQAEVKEAVVRSVVTSVVA